MMVEALTLGNYARFFADSFYQEVLGTTLWISALSTLLCLVAGFPAAYFLVRQASDKWKGRLLLLIVLPLLMGNAVRTVAWMVILGDKGLFNAVIETVGLSPVKLMYTPTAVVIGLVSVLLPFMIVTLQSVIEGIDANLEFAAQSLGASHLTVLWRVVLPLAMPGILAGTMLCFILSMNAYATPVLIGGPSFHMMVAKAMNWPFGAALAFVLMAVTLVLTTTANVLVQRRYRFRLAGGEEVRVDPGGVSGDLSLAVRPERLVLDGADDDHNALPPWSNSPPIAASSSTIAWPPPPASSSSPAAPSPAVGGPAPLQPGQPVRVSWHPNAGTLVAA